ncbi:hypothetical protein [Marinobacter sp. 2_MG-2023]|uniref:hypothetical protein n=1 Tax=Marinobacter sp. 2_MG-2023 TaxID=3062679 RepID=UPI0026E3ED0A|nr:hypothetical protein [Marinobacter sp. 2_MG-2023]MDO6442377.1 hypothetical protein [Marinobacter sp. 2_MG-2023]
MLCLQVIEQRKIITSMMAGIDEKDTAPGMEKEPELILTLKVLNPIDVAKRESRSARLLADKLPVMVRKMVYQGVMKELEEEMIQRNIDVEMNIEYR